MFRVLFLVFFVGFSQVGKAEIFDVKKIDRKILLGEGANEVLMVRERWPEQFFEGRGDFEHETQFSKESVSEIIVFGVSPEVALKMSGVTIEGKLEGDDPCSGNHNDGDFANRYCHAFFAELVYETAKASGAGEIVSHVLAPIALYAWEATNENITDSDINTAPVGGQFSKKNSAFVTIMGDGSFHLTFGRKF